MKKQPAPFKNGRPPEDKGPLRNFRLNNKQDGFLLGEKDRTRRDMTFVMEAALWHLGNLKPDARDEIFKAAIKEKAKA